MKSPHNSFSLALHVLSNHLSCLPSPIWSSFWFTTKEKGQRYHFEAIHLATLTLRKSMGHLYPPHHLVRNTISLAVYVSLFLAK